MKTRFQLPTGFWALRVTSTICFLSMASVVKDLHAPYVMSNGHWSMLMQGLITKHRKDIDPAALPFAKAHHEIEGLGLQEGAGLLEVVMLLESLGICCMYAQN